MKPERDPADLFTFTRRYASASLLAILVTAIALTALYRTLSIRAISTFGERSNLSVADVTLDAMLPELMGYLRSKNGASALVTLQDVPPALLNLIRTTVRDTPIERIKIYNPHGILLYSTREHEIGTNDSANPRFKGSIHGTVRSRLRYRDAFSFLGDPDGDDNLAETYVPIRRPGTAQPIGVLEIYTNVAPIVRIMANNELLILLSTAAILLLLYSFLLYVVRRAETVVADQRLTILERNQTLQTLSARMLQAEEAERRRVAWELHEEVAQTLGAAKVKIDALANSATGSPSLPVLPGSEEILSLLQSAIGDVRTLAMDLRPPVLDDFGLLATTRSLCREATQVHPPLGITADLSVREEDIPDALKIVIFRILQKTLKCLVEFPEVSDVRVALSCDEGLQLSIDFSTASTETGCAEDRGFPFQERPLTDFWERAVLAGGSFRTAYTDAGRIQYKATWML